MNIVIFITTHQHNMSSSDDLATFGSKGEFAEIRWKMIKEYLVQHQQKQILQHQFQSYEHFMGVTVPNKIYSYNPIVIDDVFIPQKKNGVKEPTKSVHLEIFFENHGYEDPIYNQINGKSKIMYPHDARISELTYPATSVHDFRINCDYLEDGVVVKSVRNKILKNQINGKIPIMVGSKYCMLTKYKDINEIKNECKYDKGGYMIINGNEKVLIPQEDLRDNLISVFECKRVMKYDFVCSIKSVNPNTFVSYKFQVFGSLNGGIFVKIPHIKKEIPLFIVMRAIGVKSDRMIMRTILFDQMNDSEYMEILEQSMLSGKDYNNESLSLAYIAAQFTIQMNQEEKLQYVKAFLVKNILPHLGENLQKKHIFIGIMVKQLMDVMIGRQDISDRDSNQQKVVKLPGPLSAQLHHYLFQKMIKDFKDTVVKDINTTGFDFSIENICLKYSIVENGYKYAFATGDWNVKIGNNFSKLLGVAQVLNRLNNLATISHLRRVNTPIEKSVKLTKPRKLHGTHFGKICPAETPEGGQVGAVKNTTISNSITIDTLTEPIVRILHQYDLILAEEVDVMDITGKLVKVFMNGDLIGFHARPNYLAETLVSIRRKSVIPYTTSICYNINMNELSIHTDAGRCYQPFLIVKNNRLLLTNAHVNELLHGKITWNTLLCNGIVEYLDTDEGNVNLIAMNVNILNSNDGNQYTHCEIDESFSLLGVCASLIPFPDHSQSPRNSYQSSMCKQAIGIYASNHTKRFDTLGYVLSYPQIPIVRTKMSKFMNYDNLPCGQNIIVAFGCWSGYNQEDSVIFNKSAIERGLFECYTYRTYKCEEKRKSTTMIEEKFCNPKDYDIIGAKHGNYKKLNEYGFIDPETELTGEDIIIGKVTPMYNNDDREHVIYKDNSTTLKTDQNGKIDSVVMTRNSDGYKIYKVKVRHACIPTIGDKVASRSGQKGTIGMVYRQEDMPVTEDGIVPDLIINSHAAPSRMTINQFLEDFLGEYILKTGDTTLGDATAFQDISIDDIASGLHKAGYNSMGNKTMISGQTGIELKCQMFCGPTYYQRLKHMVADKIHSRARGPVQNLTRQAVEGKSRQGGTRLGEMERDVFLSHGATHFLRERLFDCSDAYSAYVCDICHKLAVVCPNPNKFTKEPIYKCYKCDNFVLFSKIDIPYASKLFFQELESMAMNIEFHTD